MLNNLHKRLKKIEDSLRENGHVLQFDDGSMWEVNAKDWESLWDIHNLKSNPIYQKLRTEWEKGNADTNGLVHVLNAYADVGAIWADAPL